MLVVIGPPFSGSDDEFARLAGVTGLVPYELRTKLRAGVWGVVRALGEPARAAGLAERLRGAGFRAAVLDPAVGYDPQRRFVALQALSVEGDQCTLHLRGRDIPIPLRALLTIVRGEVQPGTRGASASSASATYRAVNPSMAELGALREQSLAPRLDAFAAADLHFGTVLWAARIDARSFRFPDLVGGPESTSDGPARQLEALCDGLARLAGVRVDRGSKLSSLLSFTGRPSIARSQTPAPASVGAGRGSAPPPADDRFDAYSRLVAEAERLTQLGRAE